MRKNKLIVLSTLISILSSTAIFSSDRPQSRICIDRNQPPYIIPPIDKKPQYAPGEVVVRFKIPVSEFEAAYLLGEFQPKLIGSENTLSGSYILRFPENADVERLSQFIEQNPYVESAGPNTYANLIKIPVDFSNNSMEMLRRMLDLDQILEAPSNAVVRSTEKKEETDQVSVAAEHSREAEKIYNEIPHDPERDSKSKKIHTSDPKRIIRSKVKIYSYRDSEGRLVLTNYSRCRKRAKRD
jgi:hypothetical protein